MTYLPLWLRVNDLPETALSGSGYSRVVFDFIKSGVTEEDANSIGMSWKYAIVIEPHWTMAHIAFAMGLFPSVGQARKNNWNQPIEVGYSERGGIGKRNLCYFIWNPPDPVNTGNINELQPHNHNEIHNN